MIERQGTQLLFGSLTHDFLPVQLIYKRNVITIPLSICIPIRVAHTLPKHWLTQETTAVQYAKHLPLLIIIGNLKGLVTQSNISRFLVHSHTCYIRPNTTDHLQPMDTAVTKLSKEHIQSSFRHGIFIQCGKSFSQKATLPGTHSSYNINTHIVNQSVVSLLFCSLGSVCCQLGGYCH